MLPDTQRATLKRCRARAATLKIPRSGVKSAAVTAVALLAGWAITVGGWLFSQHLARQAKRREMVVSYLLDAYRRLDRAGNRPLTPDTAQDIEAALSDMMLLGTPQQARLAEEFGKMFSAERAAEAMPLLTDLRASLRHELRLEELPAGYSSIRITMDSEGVSDRALIWREARQAAWESASAELASQQIAPVPARPGHTTGPAEAVSPAAAVAGNYLQVETALRLALASAAADDFSALNLAQLANRALQLKVIDAKLADTINGISVMRLLAALDPERLTPTQATEFSGLTTAALYLLDIAARRT